ncbi:MAG: hypothetical protein C4554_08080 [Dethiobacter sp.]|nr:MAG: hypothetical protein C4554_08080 [Dethiobacter sp.]
MEEEFELRDIWEVIIKRWILVVLISLGAVIASAIVSFYVLTPQYEASTTLMVLHAPEAGQEYYPRSSDIQLSRQLVKTYGEIVKSRRVAEAALAMADQDKRISLGALQGKIKVGLVKDTELIHITVADEEPLIAAYWATLVTRAFMEEVVKIMRVENVNILDKAVSPSSPVSPRPLLNMAVAFVLGVMVALGLAFLLEYLDNTIKLPKDVINTMQLPVLAAIPDFSRKVK